MIHKYNKGEWSELYAFLYVLAKGEIFGADEELNRDSGVKYDILSAFQKSNKYERDVLSSNVNFEIDNVLYSIPFLEFKFEADELFKEIKSGSGQTFAIPKVEAFIDKLKITSLKASNRLKGDLTFKTHDIYTNTQPTLNFSIKSYVGSKPSLLNSSTATQFNFRLSNNISDVDMIRINNIDTRAKIVDRINEIKWMGVTLDYVSVSSKIFEKNLQMIDYRMPELLGRLYLESYYVRGKKIPEVLSSFLNSNPSEDGELIEYKLRQLLIACALGLVPNTPWSGIDEATGGYLVVKDDGDILCYHIYDRNKLSNYLYNHTSFDTPSTGRHTVGKIYRDESGNQWLSLNIQIRFF